MFTMILQMFLATSMYVVLTVILWRFWHRRESHSVWQRMAVGLFYGLCSVVSNHISINYGSMLLNVRDIGPLAAGLFFSPLSGLISGFIGGVERYLVGEFLDIGSFTRVACGLSTCLAGCLSAALHKWFYRGNRPPVTHALFIGAMMEVFHMYAVLITHRDQMDMAYVVVRICSLPMITFTSLGVAACSAIILRMSGMKGAVNPWTPREKTPIDVRFQRWLLAVTTGLFVVSILLTSGFQRQMAYQQTCALLENERDVLTRRFETGVSTEYLMSQTNDIPEESAVQYYLLDTFRNQIATWSDIDSPMPLEQEVLNQVLEHAGGDAYQTRLSYGIELDCICVSGKLNYQYYLLLAVPADLALDNEDRTLEMLYSEILIFTTLYLLVSLLVNKIVVRNLDRVNHSLNRITRGDLEEMVQVRESSEFTELSGDINQTVGALRGYIDAEKKRMAEELKLASTIQESALPKVFDLHRNEFEIYALMTPAKQVGGDFYDFFFIDHNLLGLVIADVSGKGVPAALFMMRAKTAVKNFARSGNSPAEVLSKANDVLCEGNDAEMFVTVWIGIIDLRTGLMRCANAGHEYPTLMRAGGEYEIVKDKHGLPLATLEGIRMKEYELQMNPGDQLLVYTDGVPEAINEKEEAYGTERMMKKATEVRQGSEKLILENVLADVRKFAGAAEQFDDITMIGFTYKGPEA